MQPCLHMYTTTELHCDPSRLVEKKTIPLSQGFHVRQTYQAPHPTLYTRRFPSKCKRVYTPSCNLAPIMLPHRKRTTLSTHELHIGAPALTSVTSAPTLTSHRPKSSSLNYQSPQPHFLHKAFSLQMQPCLHIITVPHRSQRTTLSTHQLPHRSPPSYNCYPVHPPPKGSKMTPSTAPNSVIFVPIVPPPDPLNSLCSQNNFA